MSPRYLTKSRFLLAIECPTKLYFTGKDSEYQNLLKEASFLEMLADGGFQVGALAKLMYPGGMEITARDHATAEKETKELLKRDNVILFEPAIRHGDLFVRIDILVKEKNKFQLIEVKAKSYDSSDQKIARKRGGITSDMLPYIQDVAFQTHVLRSAYPKSRITSSLLMPDKAKQATIDGLNQLFAIQRQTGTVKIDVNPRALSEGYGDEILTLVNVDRYVAMVMKEGVGYPGGQGPLPKVAEQWAQAYKTDTRIKPTLGSHCTHCEFQTESENGLKSGFRECWTRANNWSDEDLDRGTVLDLWNFRGKDKLIEKGVVRLNQVSQDDLNYKEGDEGISNSQRQWMQIAGIPHKTDKGGFYLDAKVMKEKMKQWKYPYHFIDFETSSVALPFYKGMRPYEQIAFQFSHHTMERDGTVRHAHEFLQAKPGMFPNYEFVRALKAALAGDAGTVFMWSHHENTILERIATQLNSDVAPPADKKKLVKFISSLTKDGTRAMVDLKVLAQKAYFHPDTKGSNSIKKVLPAVMKTSSYLSMKYGQPTYGAAHGIRSLNYKDRVWWVQDANGKVIDPYDSLTASAQDLLGNDARDAITSDEFGIAEGGAAASAYARLQFETLDDNSRQRIEKALLRYCELDSLAMVMIVEAWKDVIASSARK
jgi:hypothetical protein